MDNKASKVLVTVIVVVIFIALFAVVGGIRGAAGNSTPGIIGLMLVFGLIKALKSVWKKSDDKNDLEKKYPR